MGEYPEKVKWRQTYREIHTEKPISPLWEEEEVKARLMEVVVWGLKR